MTRTYNSFQTPAWIFLAGHIDQWTTAVGATGSVLVDKADRDAVLKVNATS